MIATLLWIWFLRLLPLNKAYPIMALAFVIVPLMSFCMLGEKLELNVLVGAVIIFVGVYISIS